MCIYMRCTGMHVICLCNPCTIYSTHPARSKASERVNEQTEPGRTDERTNQPGRTNQRTNEPTWNETNQRICNTQAQHNTAQPYEATAVPFTHETKKLHLSERHVSVSRLPSLSPPTLTAYAYLIRVLTVRKYDYAVPLALYPAKMYQ